MKIIIEGTFPSLNEIIAISKSHFSKYAKQKRMFNEIIHYTVLNKHKPIKKQAHFTFNWYVIDRRKDPDNISAGAKYLFDGLVSAGILQNDGWNQVKSITHTFTVDKENPRVEIEVKEDE